MAIESIRDPVSPGVCKEIIEPLQTAIEIFTRMGRRNLVAMIQYHIGRMYSRIWLSATDEKRARNQLSEALRYLPLAHEEFRSEVPYYL